MPGWLHISFNPIDLLLARELRGLSKAELSERISKSVSSVSQFESGKIKPDHTTISEVALALAMPVAFFATPLKGKLINLESCHFRSLRSARQGDRREFLAHGTLLSELIAGICEFVDIPQDSITPLATSVSSDSDIERLANTVRTSWGLGLGPIDNLMRLVESKGAVISLVPQKFRGIDAFSTRHMGRELIFLMGCSAASRLRFDLAHELGHLLMHQDAQPGDKELERQANRFAGAFLLPKETFAKQCPRRFDLQLFYSLKKQWRVSVSAMLRRAYDLDIISESSFRRACIRLNQSGERSNEKNEFSPERPSTLRKAMNVVLEESTLDAFAKSMGMATTHVEDILKFNLDVSALNEKASLKVDPPLVEKHLS